MSSTLHHPTVVETVDLVQDEAQAWCEVMEFCAGGYLYAAIRKGGMSAAEVECCFKQLLTGLGYLHGQGVAHRDIKPENLFFDTRGQLKIGDFGASTVYRLPWETTIHKSSGLCGSEPYIAPEQFAHPSSYDARLVDIWACGIVYYCLHFQELPWGVAQLTDTLYLAYANQCASAQYTIANVPLPAAPVQPLSERAQQKEKEKEKATLYPTTIQNLSPRACRPILLRMLEPNPDHRVLIADILKNPWIVSIEVCTDPAVAPKHVHPCAVQTAQHRMPPSS
jgi:serine/threonine protein kinase